MWMVVSAMLVVVAIWFVVRVQYYRKLFSEDAYRAFHSGLQRAIENANVASGAPENFLVEPGFGVVVTYTANADEKQVLHISMSQTDRPTTRSACSHFGVFAVVMLNQNAAGLFPYFTQSGVHHMVFDFEEDTELKFRPFEETESIFADSYNPISFQRMQLEEDGSLVEVQ